MFLIRDATSPNSHEELSKQRQPDVVVALEVDWIGENKAPRVETV